MSSLDPGDPGDPGMRTHAIQPRQSFSLSPQALKELAEQLRAQSTLEVGNVGDSECAISEDEIAPTSDDADISPVSSTSSSTLESSKDEWADGISMFEAAYANHINAFWTHRDSDDTSCTDIPDLMTETIKQDDHSTKQKFTYMKPPRPHRKRCGKKTFDPYDGGVRMLKLAVFNARLARDPLEQAIQRADASISSEESQNCKEVHRRVSVLENLEKDTWPTRGLHLCRRKSGFVGNFGDRMRDTLDLRKSATLRLRRGILLEKGLKTSNYEEWHWEEYLSQAYGE